jgi:hypothetical protein
MDCGQRVSRRRSSDLHRYGGKPRAFLSTHVQGVSPPTFLEWCGRSRRRPGGWRLPPFYAGCPSHASGLPAMLSLPRLDEWCLYGHIIGCRPTIPGTSDITSHREMRGRDVTAPRKSRSSSWIISVMIRRTFRSSTSGEFPTPPEDTASHINSETTWLWVSSHPLVFPPFAMVRQNGRKSRRPCRRGKKFVPRVSPSRLNSSISPPFSSARVPRPPFVLAGRPTLTTGEFR